MCQKLFLVILKSLKKYMINNYFFTLIKLVIIIYPKITWKIDRISSYFKRYKIGYDKVCLIGVIGIDNINIPNEKYSDGTPNKINLGKLIFQFPSFFILDKKFSNPSSNPNTINNMVDQINKHRIYHHRSLIVQMNMQHV